MTQKRQKSSVLSIKVLAVHKKMDTAIQEAVVDISHKPFVDPQTLHLFQNQLASATTFIRADNPEEHFCAMFIPFDEEKKIETA